MTPASNVEYRQRELQRVQASMVQARAELTEATEQSQILEVRDKTARERRATLLQETAIRAIPFLISGRGDKPKLSDLTELDKELSLIGAARNWLQSRIPGLRVKALRTEGFALVCEADLEEAVARAEQRSSAEALAQLRETLGPNASLTIDNATFQHRLRRAGELVERGKRLLDDSAILEQQIQRGSR